MLIQACSASGRQYVFEVTTGDMVAHIALKVEKKDGIPPEQQRFIYAGEVLESSRTLGSYNIQHGSTLHFIALGARASGNVPRESLFQTGQEAYTTTTEWKALADRGDFDEDTHIVDPQAHYAALDWVERMVVTSSELYRRSGVYRLGNSGNATDPWDWTQMPQAPEWIHRAVLDIRKDDDSGASVTVASLCETYLIIVGVLDSFDLLKLRRFCTSFFSILVERSDGIVAEIVKIDKAVLVELKEALEAAITITCKEATDPESAQEALRDCLGPAVQGFIDLLNCPQPGTDVGSMTNIPEVLSLCRMVACILDLGLVCYVGSHGARFDTEYFQRDMDPLRFDLGNQLCFDCSLRSLACLDNFLNEGSVWVLRAGINLAPVLRQGKNQNKISILTTIDSLADIWGPVWAEAADQGIVGEKPTRIKKYHVSKGVIRRVREGAKPTVPGAVSCHWYGWTQDYRRLFSTLLTKTEDLSMALDDKLLIGTDIRVNSGCAYTLEQYEMNYGDMMSSLGPKPSTWKFDSAGVTLQLGAPKVVTFQIQGNVKKIPATTVKQFIWEKWSFEPERANPGMLNNCYGVEISHCTGNARRIPIKQIFLMKPMQELLERQIPNWQDTTWGKAFHQVLQTESNDAIFQFWNTHTAQRPLVGRLVRSVLDVLDSTGRTDGCGGWFRAAFVHQNCELGIDLTVSRNEWMGLLTDSYLMATYAVVNEICLECRRPDHTTSTCGDELRYTVLQTQIGLKKGSSLTGRLKIEPYSQRYVNVNDDKGDIPRFMRWQNYWVPSLGGKWTVAKELLRHYPTDSKKHMAKLILRASGTSYGGMRDRRDRTAMSCAGGVGVDEIADAPATQEALRQVEIRDFGAAAEDEMEAQDPYAVWERVGDRLERRDCNEITTATFE